MAAIKISGMTGAGSIAHNKRKFNTQNVDTSRSHLNETIIDHDLKELYHDLFDKALADYNQKKTKTRDKIPDYYKHIENGKQEQLFYEAVFQLGNRDNCPCGTPEGDKAAEVLRKFTQDFQHRNPHLIVATAVLHMDESTPHVHIDFVPVATEQTRGLSTRVSFRQALMQQGFQSKGRGQTEWATWMEAEKTQLAALAVSRGFEIEHGEGGRKHLSLPEYKAAAKELEDTQHDLADAKTALTTAQTALDATQQRNSELSEQNKLYERTVTTLQAAQSVQIEMDDIQPKKTITGAVKGVTVNQVHQLKALAVAKANQDERIAELEATTATLSNQVEKKDMLIAQASYIAERFSALSQEVEKWRDYGRHRLVQLWDSIVLPLHNRFPKLHIWTFRQASAVSKAEDPKIYRFADAKKDEIATLEGLFGGERKALEAVLESKELKSYSAKDCLADYDRYAAPQTSKPFTLSSLDDMISMARQQQQERGDPEKQRKTQHHREQDYSR